METRFLSQYNIKKARYIKQLGVSGTDGLKTLCEEEGSSFRRISDFLHSAAQRAPQIAVDLPLDQT